MIRNAWAEVRLHPGRIVATLVAIAISVAFMVASSVFIATQSNAISRQNSLGISASDVAVSISSGTKEGVTSTSLAEAIKKVDGVAAAEPVLSNQGVPSKDDRSAMTTFFGVPSEPFRWAKLSQGEWPKGKEQVALSEALADKLGAKVGDKVDLGGGAMATVSGLTDDAPSLFMQTGYVDQSVLMNSAVSNGQYAIKLAPGADKASVAKAVRQAIKPMVTDPDSLDAKKRPYLQVAPSDQLMKQASTDLTKEMDVFKYVLWIFAAISCLVGTIIIATTFSVLLAQRRRQIGLMRAVGATGSQVRRQFLAESIIIGALGSLLGIALGILVGWAGAGYTGAAWFGLSLPIGEMSGQFVTGVIITVLAAFVPAIRATRVSPLEALQPVVTAKQQRRTSRIVAGLCAVLVVLGALLSHRALTMEVQNMGSPNGPVLAAIASAMLLSIGVLVGAVLYVPALIQGVGKLLGFAGPTVKLAAANSVRNRWRTSITSVALMLAVGLIVTLQVGTATIEKSALTAIQKSYPIDLSVMVTPYGTSTSAKPLDSLPAKAVGPLEQLPNVASKVAVTAGWREDAIEGRRRVIIDDDSLRTVAPSFPKLEAGQVGVAASNPDHKAGQTMTLKGVDGKDVTLKVVLTKALSGDDLAVSKDDQAKLVSRTGVQGYWYSIADLDNASSLMVKLESIDKVAPGLDVRGSFIESAIIKQILNFLLLMMTALMGVAVLIALIGVGNVLGLSVVERARESALLRALGMKRRSLRLMLLAESLLMATVGVLIGCLAGSYFGWLGITSVMRQAKITDPTVFSINVPVTIAMVLTAVGAAALASVLPGRRAAKAAPTEALAEA